MCDEPWSTDMTRTSTNIRIQLLAWVIASSSLSISCEGCDGSQRAPDDAATDAMRDSSADAESDAVVDSNPPFDASLVTVLLDAS